MKTFLYSFVPLVLLLGVLEGAGRVREHFSPPMPFDAGMGFDENSRLFVFANDSRYRATSSEKLFQFLPQSFESTKPPGARRLIVLGESSVYHLNPELSEFGRKNGFEVINAGGLGYGSQRLVILAREMVEYSPDLVIVYLGNNEFQEIEQLQYYAPGTIATQEFLDRFAFYRLLREMLVRVWLAKLRREHDQRQLAEPFNPMVDGHFSALEGEQRMAAFRINLTEILRIFQRNKVPVLIGTVPSNLVHPVFSWALKSDYAPMQSLMEQHRYPEALAFAQQFLVSRTDRHQSSQIENRIIREVAQENHVPLIDTEKVITQAEPHGIPGETLFEDHCHLNSRGRYLWMGAFSKSITAILPIKR